MTTIITSYPQSRIHQFEMADFDRTASIRRLTGDAFGRVIFDHDLSDHPPHAIGCGVIFVHAFWAGSPVRSLADFCKSIVCVDADCRLRFIVCDIDDIPSCDPVLYGGDTSGGKGDVFWISHGRIVARHTASRSCDFDTANASLIHWCSDAHPTDETAESPTQMGYPCDEPKSRSRRF